MPFIVIALVLAAAIGGSVSFVARMAAPGDLLWGFNVAVNEHITSALAPEGKPQADLDIQMLEKRFKEAHTLIQSSTITTKTRVQIEHNIDAHIESLQQQITAIRNTSDIQTAADIAARFQAVLAANATILADDAITAENGTEITLLLTKIRATLETASSLSAELSTESVSLTQ